MKSPRRAPLSRGGARSSARSQFGELRDNFNAQTFTVLGMVVFGIVMVAPNVQLFFEQRQAIADLQSQVQQSKDDVAQMKVERNRWNDPAYVRAQARDRLYFVMPGEVSYLVMDADTVDDTDTSGTVGAALAAKSNYSDISSKISATKTDWLGSVVSTVVRAGVTTPEEAGK